MNAPSAGNLRLPALRIDAAGRRRVDMRAVIALAVPLVANSSVQAVLNLTDTWFVGRLSAQALAAMGVVYWLTIVVILLLGGAALAVQTFVAQAYGAGDRLRAAHAAWNGLWVALATAPLFVVTAYAGPWLLRPFGLAPEIRDAALQFWAPRMLGGPFAVALWALTGFFNGVGRTGVTLAVMSFSAVLNAALNQAFIFGLGWGVAGAGWATTVSTGVAVLLTGALLSSRTLDRDFPTRASMAFDRRLAANLLRTGIPMGLFPSIDVGALAVFQLMLSGVGTVDGAASQIVMMLTSLAYLPTIGFALAGTTLVGQSIGAGNRDWAARVGNATVRMCVGYMGMVSVFLALAGPWLLPLFIHAHDATAAEVVALGRTLLWFAAGYQIFDGLNLGAGFCLRGAGDMRVPTLMIVCLAWFGFVPLAHMAIFPPGQGWLPWLPRLGYGAAGGWAAALLYTCALGTLVWLRWRSGAWRRIELPR
ncbi:MAG TPA: MATE family efflux transporter [Burkholderiales bacterium]|nr:MATE family efflux transporter [Burkholderiales bacterium]